MEFNGQNGVELEYALETQKKLTKHYMDKAHDYANRISLLKGRVLRLSLILDAIHLALDNYDDCVEQIDVPQWLTPFFSALRKALEEYKSLEDIDE